MEIDGAALRRLRSERAWSQAALAARIGCAIKTIQRLEAGRTQPQATTLQAIAATLDVAPTALLTPHRTLRAAPLTHQLAPPARSLIGRDAELGLLRVALASPGCRGATITGMPGVGRRALAHAFAAAVADDLPAAQICFDAGATGPGRTDAAIMRHVLWSLGAPCEEIASARADLARLTAAYRAETRGVPLLLLLENVLDEATLEAVTTLDAGFVVATSRRRLTAVGMCAVRLRGLEHDDAARLVSRWVPAVDDARRLADVCAGHPLSLVCAARALAQPEVDPAELVAHLTSPRHAVGALDAATAASPLRAALEQGLSDLGYAQREALRTLAALSPGWSRSDAACACRLTERDAAELLSALLREHAIEHVGARGRDARYLVHPLIRGVVQSEHSASGDASIASIVRRADRVRRSARAAPHGPSLEAAARSQRD